jgi:imidazolonepropionase-like amidohydrolase
MARQLGVRLAPGTDAGSAGVQHGLAMIKEMRLTFNAGYPNEKVIECATHNGALLMGWSQERQIKKDQTANFNAVSGDPSQLLESLDQI